MLSAANRSSAVDCDAGSTTIHNTVAKVQEGVRERERERERAGAAASAYFQYLTKEFRQVDKLRMLHQ